MPTSRKNKQDKSPGYKYAIIAYETVLEVDNYINNPSMIKKLYNDHMAAIDELNILRNHSEDLRASNYKLESEKQVVERALEEANRTVEKLRIDVSDLKNQAGNLSSVNHQLELDKLQAEHDLKHTQEHLEKLERKSLPKYLFTTLGIVIASIGINLATSMPSSWIAWVMVVAGVLLGLAAFFIIGKDN
jgi:chromosome segregation ATPase